MKSSAKPKQTKRVWKGIEGGNGMADTKKDQRQANPKKKSIK